MEKRIKDLTVAETLDGIFGDGTTDQIFTPEQAAIARQPYKSGVPDPPMQPRTIETKLSELRAYDLEVRNEMFRLSPTDPRWHDRAREHEHNVKMLAWLEMAARPEGEGNLLD